MKKKMPRLKRKKKVVEEEPEEDELEEEDYEGMDEEDLDEHERLAIEEENRARGKRITPRKVQKEVAPLGKTEAPMKRVASPMRFVAFRNPERVGIIDSESNEMIAEGEFALLQGMANILTRLERIETTLGSMIEE